MSDLLILFGVSLVFVGAMGYLNTKTRTTISKFATYSLMWAGVVLAAATVVKIAGKAWR